MKLSMKKVGLRGRAGKTRVQGLDGEASKAEIICVPCGCILLDFYHIASRMKGIMPAFS